MTPSRHALLPQVGDELPDISLDELVEGDIKPVSLKELFKGKKGILFGVPGGCRTSRRVVAACCL